MLAPCQGCLKRYRSVEDGVIKDCHTHCPEYLQYRAQQEAIYKQRLNEAQRISDLVARSEHLHKLAGKIKK